MREFEQLARGEDQGGGDCRCGVNQLRTGDETGVEEIRGRELHGEQVRVGHLRD